MGFELILARHTKVTQPVMMGWRLLFALAPLSLLVLTKLQGGQAVTSDAGFEDGMR